MVIVETLPALYLPAHEAKVEQPGIYIWKETKIERKDEIKIPLNMKFAFENAVEKCKKAYSEEKINEVIWYLCH